MLYNSIPQSFNLQFRDSGRSGAVGRQNFSTTETDVEAMARVPAASVMAVDAMLQNYTIISTSTMAGPTTFNRSSSSGLLDAAAAAEPLNPEDVWLDSTLHVLKVSVMISIIVAAIFGNLLVIASVMRVRKLRYAFGVWGIYF